MDGSEGLRGAGDEQSPHRRTLSTPTPSWLWHGGGAGLVAAGLLDLCRLLGVLQRFAADQTDERGCCVGQGVSVRGWSLGWWRVQVEWGVRPQPDAPIECQSLTQTLPRQAKPRGCMWQRGAGTEVHWPHSPFSCIHSLITEDVIEAL